MQYLNWSEMKFLLSLQLLMTGYLVAQDEGIGELPDTEEFRDFKVPDLRKKLPGRDERSRGNTVGGVRFFRLQHNGKDWNLNWGLKGDFRMLAEFHRRTNGIPIAKSTEQNIRKTVAWGR
jgi:hypothetical protein